MTTICFRFEEKTYRIHRTRSFKLMNSMCVTHETGHTRPILGLTSVKQMFDQMMILDVDRSDQSVTVCQSGGVRRSPLCWLYQEIQLISS